MLNVFFQMSCGSKQLHYESRKKKVVIKTVRY